MHHIQRHFSFLVSLGIQLSFVLPLIAVQNTDEQLDSKRKQDNTASYYDMINKESPCFKILKTISKGTKIFPEFIKLSANIDPTKCNHKGATLLHAAAQCGNNQVVDILIQEHKMPINVQDQDGKTPLHYAATATGTNAPLMGICPDVQYLLDKGTNPLAATSEGNTPLEELLAQRDKHIADNAGVKFNITFWKKYLDTINLLYNAEKAQRTKDYVNQKVGRKIV